MSTPILSLTPYAIDEHSHRFAAWAASRAASVKGCRFAVEQGLAMLETAGFTAGFVGPGDLPEPGKIDEWHRERRAKLIFAGTWQKLTLTHGVAAKLINVYLKARFVCGGYVEDPKVAALHPPIDRLLLHALFKKDFSGDRDTWRQAKKTGWSNFSSAEYEALICALRAGLKGAPFWKIEVFWQGHQ